MSRYILNLQNFSYVLANFKVELNQLKNLIWFLVPFTSHTWNFTLANAFAPATKSSYEKFSSNNFQQFKIRFKEATEEFKKSSLMV